MQNNSTDTIFILRTIATTPFNEWVRFPVGSDDTPNACVGRVRVMLSRIRSRLKKAGKPIIEFKLYSRTIEEHSDWFVEFKRATSAEEHNRIEFDTEANRLANMFSASSLMQEV